MTIEEIKSMNLFEKMLHITEEMGVIQKNLEVASGYRSYKAVSERDVLDNVKELESKYRVYSYPFSRDMREMDFEYYKDKKPTVIRVETTYRFVNIDNPEETLDIISYGDGIDTQDKAPGKAMTYADKYALMKAYKISTGDDPDAEGSCDKPLTPPKTLETKTVKKATEAEIAKIKEMISEERLPKMLEAFKVSKLEDLSETDALKAIKLEENKLKKEAEEKAKEVKAEVKEVSEKVSEKVEEVANEVKKVSKENAEKIKAMFPEERLKRMCSFYKVAKIEDLDETTASRVIKKGEAEKKKAEK